ncbi:unnamed protein product [Rotaria sordida]|uniref:Uncharacterized protein n=1 Tax=Rotaria sordida TaxID=392033 RepID=A0A814KW68_9BILA|nr:unnamed protein product [Rotaria sordida]
MIRQHFLQQQRLNHNHDRLLERYQRLISPQISEFRAFGTSSLPGRNYEQYLRDINCNPYRRDSLVALSRAGIGSSSETYRWLGNEASEILPRNVSSIMKHARQQPMSIVHAEKFEPVQIYEHPVFGPTPAYLRPIYNETQRQRLREIDNDSSSSENDYEVRSHISDHEEERKTSSTTVKDVDDVYDDGPDYVPKGYISYKKWKAKYEHLIPVNPLLFNIYIQRPNGSINSFGRSLYTSLNHIKPHRPSSRDEDVSSPSLSDTDSVSSEVPYENTSISSRQYNRLQPSLFRGTIKPQPLKPIRAGDTIDLSDDELTPPNSPVSYLSRNKPNLITPTSISNIVPSTSIKSPSIPTTGITSSSSPLPPTTSSSLAPTTVTTSSPSVPKIGRTLSPLTPTTEATSSLLAPTTETTSSLSAPTTEITPTLNTSHVASGSPVSSTNASNIPPAPPLPPSLLTTTSTHSYQKPSNFPISSPPIPPPVPRPLSNSSASAMYQTPSIASLSLSSAPPLPSSIPIANSTKAVTFGGSSSIPITNKDKRRQQRKRRAQAAAGFDVHSSSSDD